MVKTKASAVAAWLQKTSYSIFRLRQSFACRNSVSGPSGGKDVKFITLFGIFIGAEDQSLPIRREFREGCESTVIRDLPKSRSIESDFVQFKLPAVALLLIGGE